ncbi:MAG TPA: acyl-CoA thioester hydrolase/BAAT C-terminal domain-containing protein [Vicinamibacterales bacterium]|nr:acyl-CoA thioester hydrolase/BAAT C-terminal domain-containing protein [Vicinamibacterales bacterium]
MIDVIKVNDEGLVAALYLPPVPAREKAPAIIVLSGSDGGIATTAMHGEPLAALGYAVLALAYFAMDGLPRDLVEIPLEYFKRAIDWLRAHPAVDPERIGLLGHSRGGEAALLIAATYPEVRLVVANVPSHVVWAGIDPDTWQRRSSWNLGGVGRPFVSLLRPPDASTSWRELFEETLRDAVAAADAAAIPVERIKGPILFVTGSDDGVWPSAEMADLAIERLKRHTFPFSYEHARYRDAGHAILMPPYRVGPINNPWPSSSYTPPRWFASAQIQLGGTSEGNRLARMAAWPAMTAFLAQHFQSNQERV